MPYVPNWPANVRTYSTWRSSSALTEAPLLIDAQRTVMPMRTIIHDVSTPPRSGRKAMADVMTSETKTSDVSSNLSRAMASVNAAAMASSAGPLGPSLSRMYRV